MCPASVRFTYSPGLPANPFRNVRLAGSWDAAGRSAPDWSFTPMQPTADDDGCPAFDAVVNFDDSAIGRVLRWGVMLDGPLGEGLWGIASEVDDVTSTAREQSFTLQTGAQNETYYLTHCGRFGALPQSGSSGIRFSLWAPNARSIDLVFGDPAHGYIADNGSGALQSIVMAPMLAGIWQVTLDDFSEFVGRPYMFRVVKDDGTIAFRNTGHVVLHASWYKS